MRYAWRLIACTAILLTGCSVSNIANQAPDPVTAQSNSPLNGSVHGGQNPIQGAHVYLFAVSTSGYGSPSASLLNSTGTQGTGPYYVTTNASGVFAIAANQYSCTSGQEVYLYSVNGNPQAGGGTNAAAGLMAVVGKCGAGSSFTGVPNPIQLNEVTTVAAAYALAGFATDATDMAGANTALAIQGINNAGSSAANLASLSTGAALATTPAGNGTVPQTKINALANVLAACINSSAGPASTPCTTLFSNAMNGATAPTDTATAAINIAHNPAANVTALYNVGLGYAQFLPTLSGAPNDWTLAISYTGGGLAGVSSVAIDGTGNVWVTDTAAVSEFNTLGAAVSASGGYTATGLTSPYGIAVDPTGNVWVTNFNNNTISELNSSGADIFDSAAAAGGLSNPAGIAIDGTGNLWVANHSAQHVSNFSSSGAAIAGSPWAGGGLNDAFGIATTGGNSGDVWVANSTSGAGLSEFNLSGAAQSPTVGGYTNGGVNEAIYVAVDASGYVWSSNYGATSLSALNSSGTALAGSPFTGGGLTGPYGIAVDGASNVWVANIGPYPGSISEFNHSGAAITGANGYLDGLGGGGLSEPNSIAVDGSGNVWVTDDGDSKITELVGAGVPVVTPLSVGAANTTLGTKP